MNLDKQNMLIVSYKTVSEFVNKVLSLDIWMIIIFYPVL